MTENKETAIQKIGTTSSVVNINTELIKGRLEEIKAFQSLVQSQLEEGKDYGVIPGTKKPTLLKPGAEKIVKLLMLDDEYEILKEIEDFDRPLFHYVVKCKLISLETSQTISEGLGSCNSMENKYRYRSLWENQLSPAQVEMVKRGELVLKSVKGKGGKWYKKAVVLNEDIYTIANTILKMAKKRAIVDAALSVGRLSNLFTQDMEDIRDSAVAETQGKSEIIYKAEVLKDAPKKTASKKRIADKDKDISELVPEKPEEESTKAYKNITIILSDGREKKIDKFEFLNYFQKIKGAIGDLNYYAILNQEGYEKSNLIPPKSMNRIYGLLLDSWKFQQQSAKREKERTEKDA